MPCAQTMPKDTTIRKKTNVLGEEKVLHSCTCEKLTEKGVQTRSPAAGQLKTSQALEHWWHPSRVKRRHCWKLAFADFFNAIPSQFSPLQTDGWDTTTGLDWNKEYAGGHTPTYSQPRKVTSRGFNRVEKPSQWMVRRSTCRGTFFPNSWLTKFSV